MYPSRTARLRGDGSKARPPTGQPIARALSGASGLELAGKAARATAAFQRTRPCRACGTGRGAGLARLTGEACPASPAARARRFAASLRAQAPSAFGLLLTSGSGRCAGPLLAAATAPLAGSPTFPSQIGGNQKGIRPSPLGAIAKAARAGRWTGPPGPISRSSRQNRSRRQSRSFGKSSIGRRNIQTETRLRTSGSRYFHGSP